MEKITLKDDKEYNLKLTGTVLLYAEASGFIDKGYIKTVFSGTQDSMNVPIDIMMKTIYMSLQGGNTDFKYSFDEFLGLCDLGLLDVINYFSKCLMSDKTSFGNEFESKTAPSKKKLLNPE